MVAEARISERSSPTAQTSPRSFESVIVEEEYASARLEKEEISTEERGQMLGGVYEVLVEGVSKDGQRLKGRTRCWKKVLFEGDEKLIGTLQQVKIHSFSHQTLVGNKLI